MVRRGMRSGCAPRKAGPGLAAIVLLLAGLAGLPAQVAAKEAPPPREIWLPQTSERPPAAAAAARPRERDKAQRPAPDCAQAPERPECRRPPQNAGRDDKTAKAAMTGKAEKTTRIARTAKSEKAEKPAKPQTPGKQATSGKPAASPAPREVWLPS